MHNLQSFSIAIYLLCLALCVLVYGKYLRKGAQSQLPPGPRPFRIVGNIKDVPTTHEWLRFTEWSKAYGDVVYIHVLGNPLVILSSTQAAKDLLEARSAIYSCRPRFPMISELMGWDWAVQFMPYGAQFKKFRKSVQNNLHQQAIVDYRPMIQSCADCLLDAIYSEPDAFLDHISHGVGNLMISVIYGVEDNERRERYIHNADKAIEGLIVAGNVGTFLVDVIPALKYIPEWFPGASFKQKARKWRRLARRHHRNLVQTVTDK